MQTRKQQYMQLITSVLSMYKSNIEINNAINLCDLSTTAEDLLCGLLNLVYELKLINLNGKKMNYPGIDLGDTENRVAIQITANNSRKKVEDALKSFNQYNYISEYSRLVIVILGDRRSFAKDFETGILTFSEKEDIIDIKQIVRDINCLEIDRIELIYNYLERELISPLTKKGVSYKAVQKTLKNDYAKSHNNQMVLKAEGIYTQIQQLKNRYHIDDLWIGGIREALKEVRTDIKNLTQYHNEIQLSNKAFLFIQSLDKSVLKWLYDIGIRINIQVVEGQAQWYAKTFFDRFFRYLKEGETGMELVRSATFGGYALEQIQRIVNSYEQIINFEPNRLGFSTGYICPKEDYGNLLAVSVSGDTNKIYVWDIESRDRQPIAVLAGLFEQVYKVKILRVEDKIYIIACGCRQIYLWDIKSEISTPTSIYRAEAGVGYYDIYRSKNNNVYIIGRGHKKLYFWELGGSEKPLLELNTSVEDGDIFVVNTGAEQGRTTYSILGDSAESCDDNNKIYILREKEPLEFKVEYACDEREIIGGFCEQRKLEFGVDSYEIMSSAPILGVLTRKALFLYDFEQRKNVFIMHQEGQQIYDFEIRADGKNDICLLIYYLYSSQKDDGRGLVRCYRIRDGRVVDQHECFRTDVDIRKAIMTKTKDELYVFFNQYSDGVIFETTYDRMDKYQEFYVLPKSMGIIDMTGE